VKKKKARLRSRRQPQTQGAHLQRPPPRLAEVEEMKNARLHSRRQPQTPRARLQRPPPRLAAKKNPKQSPPTAAQL
jgi:hypothetical protein